MDLALATDSDPARERVAAWRERAAIAGAAEGGHDHQVHTRRQTHELA